jgi:hypothetical protein
MPFDRVILWQRSYLNGYTKAVQVQAESEIQTHRGAQARRPIVWFRQDPYRVRSRQDQMARSKTQSPQPPSRRMRGFEAASGLLQQRIREAGEARGFAVTRLLTQWSEVAGQEIARITRPVKIGYGREGMGATLTLLVSPAHAPMVQMDLPRLKDRVNAAYGYAAISRISLTQTAATGFAEGQAEFTAAPKRPTAVDPALQAEARAVAAPVHDETLRAALEALAQNILNRRKTT